MTIYNSILRKLLLFILIFYYSEGCGVTTHNLIAHEAFKIFQGMKKPESNIYKKLILKHPDAFQSGVAFPDWGYNCPLKSVGYDNLPDASEAAHWPPFQNATVNYIRNLPKPWTEATEKLIVFLFGVVSHATADIAWHNIAIVHDSGQGFIQALANANYNAQGQSYPDAAHWEADTGGEFVAAAEYDLKFLTDSWYIPIDDLPTIYQHLGVNGITPFALKTCVELLYAEVMALKYLPTEEIYDHYADQAPFLVDEFQEWFLGGVHHMAAATTHCWATTMTWIEDGPSKESLCFIEQDPSSLKDKTFLNHKTHNLKLPSTVKVESKVTLNGITISLNGVEALEQDRQFVPRPDTGASKTCKTVKDFDSTVFEIYEPFSELGYAMVSDDFNKDGNPEIVLSAPLKSWHHGIPHHGSLYVISLKEIASGVVSLDDYDNADSKSGVQLIHGADESGRFGWAMTTLDFNLDGFPDLVVSAPGVGADQLKYYGRVYVFFGSPKGLSDVPNVLITSRIPFSGLGFTLKSMDIDGDGFADLVIGSPFAPGFYPPYPKEAGQVWVFKSSPLHKAGQILTSRDTLFKLCGFSIFQWFGYDLELFETGSKRILAIGSPLYNNGSGSFGMVSGYDLTNWNHLISPFASPLWTLQTSYLESELGREITFGKFGNGPSFLAVSMPTWISSDYQTGAVELVQIIDKLEGKLFIEQMNPIILTTKSDFSRFGWSLGMLGNGWMWVSEPLKYTGAGLNAGGITFWNSAEQNSYCIDSSVAQSRFGTSVLPINRGDGKTFDLLVSSPKDPSLALNAGKVYLLRQISLA